MTTAVPVHRPRVAMVRPPRATVARGLADIHAEPSDASELVDQAFLGEPVTILGRRDDWAWVQGVAQYFGWIRRDALAPAVAGAAGAPAGRVVAVHGAVVRAAAAAAAAAIDALAPGTAVAHGPVDPDGWLRCGAGWLAADDTIPVAEIPIRPPAAEDLLVTAETYLGTPYLWGGVSARGIDCSGFTQQVYRLNGVALPRDADQQALAGRAIDAALAGDLLFFGAERVTHTAIATGPRTFLHAPKKGAFVERGELGPERRLLAIRRYLL